MPVLATVPSLPLPTAPSPTVFVRGLGELFGHSPGMLTMWSRIRWTGYPAQINTFITKNTYVFKTNNERFNSIIKEVQLIPLQCTDQGKGSVNSFEEGTVNKSPEDLPYFYLHLKELGKHCLYDHSLKTYIF